jgi:hypothetical protein
VISVDNQRLVFAEIAGLLREPTVLLFAICGFRHKTCFLSSIAHLPNCSLIFYFTFLLTFILIINDFVGNTGKIVAQKLLTYCSIFAHFLSKQHSEI